MNEIRLRCMSKKYRDSAWLLQFDDAHGQGVLIDFNGVVARVIFRAEAQNAFRLPSFSQSIKYLGIVTGIGMLEFAVSKDEIRRVKDFMDEALISSSGNSAEIARLRKSGMWELLGGIGLTIVGIVVTIFGYIAASRGRGGSYYILWGLVLWGIVMACRGGSKLSRAARLSSRATPRFAVLPTAVPAVSASPPPPLPPSASPELRRTNS